MSMLYCYVTFAKSFILWEIEIEMFIIIDGMPKLKI